MQERWDLQVFRDLEEKQDHQENKENQEEMESQELLDHLAHQDVGVYLVCLVFLVLRVIEDFLD